jgi:hypothetical protein
MTEQIAFHEITDELLLGFKSKKYYSGREIEVGDKLGWGFFNYKHSAHSELSMTLSSFHIDEIDSIYTIERMAGTLPVLSIIGK